MRKHLLIALVVLGASIGVVGAATPVSAGGGFPTELLPSLTVKKVVVPGEHPVTVTGLFTIQVSCVDTKDGEDSFVATLTFNADGSPHSAPGGWVDTGTGWSFQDWDLLRATCTVTEQAGGAANSLAAGSPTYACSFTNEAVVEDTAAIEQTSEEPGCLTTDGVDPAAVHFGHPWDDSCEAIQGDGTLCVQTGVITVTNTLEQDPSAVQNQAVTVTPKFTG